VITISKGHQPARSAQNKRRRPHLTAQQERSLRARLRKTTPSEPWVEAQFKSAEQISCDGSTAAYRYHDPHVFPPGGPLHTKMIRCPKCGVYMPPNAFEHGACLDHARHEGWGPSPSAIAIQRLQLLNLRLSDAQLPPEDTESLRREIRKYEKKHRRIT
jgi:hypothetical protein